MLTLRHRLIALLALLALVACQNDGSGPTPSTPTLTLTPTSTSVNAGDAPVTFTATVQNSTETVAWAYSGPGSVAPSSGPSTVYTPPASVDSVQSGSLTATLGTTGVSASAAIVINPVGTDPTDPTDTTDPTDPTDATDPTDTTDPTDPTDSTDPTDPTSPTPEMTVNITNVAPVMLDPDGSVYVTLKASTSNAPSGVSYKWTTQGNNPGTVSFDPDTVEDTTARIDGSAGVYALKLTATAGSATATDTVSITVEAFPNATGYWSGKYTDPETSMAFDLVLDLVQNFDNVDGTLNTLPMKGIILSDGALTLDYTGTDGKLRIVATVRGEEMTGNYLTGDTLEQVYPFTATRQQPQ